MSFLTLDRHWCYKVDIPRCSQDSQDHFHMSYAEPESLLHTEPCSVPMDPSLSKTHVGGTTNAHCSTSPHDSVPHRHVLHGEGLDCCRSADELESLFHRWYYKVTKKSMVSSLHFWNSWQFPWLVLHIATLRTEELDCRTHGSCRGRSQCWHRPCGCMVSTVTMFQNVHPLSDSLLDTQ